MNDRVYTKLFRIIWGFEHHAGMKTISMEDGYNGSRLPQFVVRALGYLDHDK